MLLGQWRDGASPVQKVFGGPGVLTIATILAIQLTQGYKETSGVAASAGIATSPGARAWEEPEHSMCPQLQLSPTRNTLVATRKTFCNWPLLGFILLIYKILCTNSQLAHAVLDEGSLACALFIVHVVGGHSPHIHQFTGPVQRRCPSIPRAHAADGAVGASGLYTRALRE
jgi:hypothetical protein